MSVPAVEVRSLPVCPLHPGSTVWRDGTYGRRSRRRPRFKCVPRNGEPRHVFTETLPRTIGERHECPECERALAPHEGPPAPRLYEYTIGEIADALIAVGCGQTYRRAGMMLRENRGRRRVRYSRFDARTVGAWVEVFVPPIWEALRPRVWPEIVVLDSLPFHVSGTRVNALGHPLQGGAPAFQVFGAMGYYRRGEVKLIGLRAYDGFDLHQGEPSWERFLRGLKLTLDGSPRQFVCDGDSDITRAINRLWLPGEPDSPALVSCHYHLRAPILEDLRQSRIEADDPLYVAALHAFDDVAHWDAFEEIANARRRELPQHTRNHIARHADRIRHQMAHYEVVDNTAIEQFFAELKGRFRTRRGSFRNRRRTNRLLALMLLEQRRQARRAEYMRIIRETLLANGGRGTPSHRIDCAHGHPTLGGRRARPDELPPREPSQADEPDIPF